MILDWRTPLNDSCPGEKDGGKEGDSPRQKEKLFAGLGDVVFKEK